MSKSKFKKVINKPAF